MVVEREKQLETVEAAKDDRKLLLQQQRQLDKLDGQKKREKLGAPPTDNDQLLKKPEENEEVLKNTSESDSETPKKKGD